MFSESPALAVSFPAAGRAGPSAKCNVNVSGVAGTGGVGADSNGARSRHDVARLYSEVLIDWPSGLYESIPQLLCVARFTLRGTDVSDLISRNNIVTGVTAFVCGVCVKRLCVTSVCGRTEWLGRSMRATFCHNRV